MEFIPKYVKRTPLSLMLKLECVSDKRGNILFAVTMCQGVHENIHFCFSRLESALDFINTNFND